MQVSTVRDGVYPPATLGELTVATAGLHAAIRIDGLTRTFGKITAVDHLTLEVPRAAVFGFLGPNGAGKTTTIRLLLGLLEPDSGRVDVLGFDPGTRGQKSVRGRVRCSSNPAFMYATIRQPLRQAPMLPQ